MSETQYKYRCPNTKCHDEKCRHSVPHGKRHDCDIVCTKQLDQFKRRERCACVALEPQLYEVTKTVANNIELRPVNAKLKAGESIDS